MLRNLGGGAEQARRECAASGEQRNRGANHSECNTASHRSTNDYSSSTANGDDNAATHRPSSATEYAGSEPNQSGGDGGQHDSALCNESDKYESDGQHAERGALRAFTRNANEPGQ